MDRADARVLMDFDRHMIEKIAYMHLKGKICAAIKIHDTRES